jgi:outer membrane cobalamin receptor
VIRRKSASAANVSVITAEEIADSGATSIVEVLDKLESVQFRTYSGNSTQAQIDIAASAAIILSAKR